jgi:ketosteroid isomerase-like protein
MRFAIIAIHVRLISNEEESSMRNPLSIAALALTIAASACSGPRQQEFTRDDAEAIRKSTATLAAAVNEKNVDGIVALYDENSVFMPPNAPMLRGREPLKSFYGELIARGAVDFKLDVDTVAGHGPLGYESGTYSMSLKSGARDRGKYLRVLRKTNDAWRVEYTIWSSDLPKPTGAVAD